MRKITITGLMFVFLLTSATFAFAQSDRGSIQGYIYRDTNGDGICQDGTPLPGATVNFDLPSINSKISVRSAADGSYNVGSAAQGTWTINATTRSGRWIAVSPNPIQLEVNSGSGLVKEGVNFCMQRVAVAGVMPSNDLPEPTVTLTDPSKSLAEQSKELLTTPPESVQPDAAQLETVMSETVEEKAVPVDEWLGYLNSFRAMAGVPAVREDSGLTFGAQSHARYMVFHDRPIAHAEDPSFALYSREGHIAGANGLIFATSQLQADHTWATNFFVSGPFHLIPMIDPYLETVGFGSYVQDIGNFKMAGVLDVRSGLTSPDGSADYPIMFPTDGAETWVLRHSLYEWPDPVPGCAHLGFSRATGSPIVLMLGAGDKVPQVTKYQVRQDGQPIKVCMFNESNYTNPDPIQQSTGRIIMNLRDAVVLIPEDPLAADATYNVSIEVDGETHAWSFSTRKGP